MTLTEMQKASEAYAAYCTAILEERRPNISHPAMGDDSMAGVEFGPRYKSNMIRRVNERFDAWVARETGTELGIADLATTGVRYR